MEGTRKVFLGTWIFYSGFWLLITLHHRTHCKSLKTYWDMFSWFDFKILLLRHNLTKNQVHHLSGVTWSLFPQNHFVSPYIFHCIYIEFSSSTFSCFWHLYLVLIRVSFLGGHTSGYLTIRTLNLLKTFADVSISERIQNFDNFFGFSNPEFDSFMTDLTIFWLICNW